MTGKIILAIGMPRAGSGWYYNLVHDVVTAAGGQDARIVRRRYRLGKILTEVNCNIGTLSPQRIVPVTIPALTGNTFAIKTHAGPKPFAVSLIDRGLIKPTYIYRDPRDALLSAYEYGKRKRAAGQRGSFTNLKSIEDAIEFIQDYVKISGDWLGCQAALKVRYEDMLNDYEAQVESLLAFLGLKAHDPVLSPVINKYRSEKGGAGQKGIHFVKGKIGRFRQKLTSEQQQRCLDAFGDSIERMGYPL